MADNGHQDHDGPEELTGQKLLDHVKEVIASDRDRRKRIRRRVRLTAATFVIVAGLAGGLLILASGHTHGYWSSLLSALGAGALAGAVFAMAAPLIAGLWHAGDESNEFRKIAIYYLEELSKDLEDLWNETVTPQIGKGRTMAVQRADRNTREIDRMLREVDELLQNPSRHRFTKARRILMTWRQNGS